MDIFLDSANLDEIKKVQDLGILDGITTNPTLISKEGVSTKEQLIKINSITYCPINVEVLSTTAADMVKEAKELVSVAKNVIIKVPITEEGLKAVRLLRLQGIKTNLTLCFSITQAILAVKVQADYVSPFVGRLDDVEEASGMNLVREMCDVYSYYPNHPKIIVASIRNLDHIVESQLAEADIVTIPYKIIVDMMKHPLTDAGIKKFLKDYAGIK